MTQSIDRLAPILPVRDIVRTERFYSALGFRNVFFQNGYAILRMGVAEIRLIEDPEHVATERRAVYMTPTDVDALWAFWSTLDLPTEGLPRVEPVEDKPWGMREVTVVDPDGNILQAGNQIPGWSPDG